MALLINWRHVSYDLLLVQPVGTRLIFSAPGQGERGGGLPARACCVASSALPPNQGGQIACRGEGRGGTGGGWGHENKRRCNAGCGEVSLSRAPPRRALPHPPSPGHCSRASRAELTVRSRQGPMCTRKLYILSNFAFAWTKLFPHLQPQRNAACP